MASGAPFQIYEDQENRVPGVRGKREGLKVLGNSNGNQPRTAFGVLSTNNQALNIRVQPSRTAKQSVNYDAGSSKVYQDENAYARQKSASSSSASSSQLSFKIFCDNNSTEQKKSGESNSSISISDAVVSSTTSISEKSMESSSDAVDKHSLDYAASKLKEISLPACITELPRATVSSVDAMEVGDEESISMSVCTTPADPQQEHLLKCREELMYDMAEYSHDIYLYLRDAEARHRPRENYMTKQTDITVSMRWILVDWMVEVAEEYNLSTETLYLAVSYIDRFLSLMSVKRDKLQLVGTTAMFIASKYEEIYPPDVGQFAYITDNTYKVNHILRMEHLILKVLSFDVAVPTAYAFINMFSRTLGCTEKTTFLAQYIAELSMLDCAFLAFMPSQIAATALAIANFTQGHTPWPTKMVEAFNIELNEMKNCYLLLNKAFCSVNEPESHSIREKYKSLRVLEVACIKSRPDHPFSS